MLNSTAAQPAIDSLMPVEREDEVERKLKVGTVPCKTHIKYWRYYTLVLPHSTNYSASFYGLPLTILLHHIHK